MRSRSTLTRFLLVSSIAFLGPAAHGADEKLEGIACRSVHLQYAADRAVAFYNEVTIEKSSAGTYFCVAGFNKGYFGLQELGRGRKVVIFSVWDPGRQDDPDSVDEERRVKLLHRHPEVRIGRFGNEGTGGQSFFDYDWKVGETYRLMVTARAEGERTEFAAHFFLPERKEWKHLATFSTITGGKLLGGYYSFIEDFRRNRISAAKVRRAYYGNGWVRTPEGQWVALTRARFTADRNPVLNIDAGVDGARFFLATGGDTKNEHTPLREHMNRPPAGVPALPPAATPKSGEAG